MTAALDEDRFRKIFEQSHDAIFVIDPDADEIIDVNARACAMLGYDRQELLSVPMSAVHPHEVPRLRAFAETVYAHGQGFTSELSCRAKNGGTIPAEISASMIDLHDRPHMVAFVRDVSGREATGEVTSAAAPAAIVGTSPALRAVLEQVRLVADTSASVLITGESGTGKELVARAIHEGGARRDRPLVRVNCASIPRELFESEFFGHVKGGFTGAVSDRQGRFELADGGTLFLDEVGEIPHELQGKLLRVLQEGQFERVGESRTRSVDVRVLAATNRDLLADVRAGRFREDLYYRLGVFPIVVPPLRERREDIAPLLEHLLSAASARLGVPRPRVPAAELARLEAYEWPGNVRELQNVVDRAVILARGGAVSFSFLSGGSSAPPAPPAPAEGLTLADLKRLEREIIEHALSEAGGRLYGAGGAAERLDVKPTTLASRMKRLGIDKPPRR